jgi:pimeloyl-ACP methyl ester carboxylesterase
MAFQRAIFAVIPERKLLDGISDFVPVQASGLRAVAREDVRPMGKHGLAAAMRAAGGVRFRGRLTEVRTPTLVVCGSKDRPNLPAARELGRGIPEAELRIVPGVGHAWNLEAPEQFTAMVRGFVLASAAGRQSGAQ